MTGFVASGPRERQRKASAVAQTEQSNALTILDLGFADVSDTRATFDETRVVDVRPFQIAKKRVPGSLNKSAATDS